MQLRLGNNLWETYNYRTPGTATSYNLGTTQGGWERTQLEYGFHATQNNGNVQNQTIRRGTGNTWIQSYTYDALNRLWTVSESSGGTWSQTYSYDRYGNRYISSNTNMPPITNEPTLSSQFNAANNRLTTLAGMTINYEIKNS